MSPAGKPGSAKKAKGIKSPAGGKGKGGKAEVTQPAAGEQAEAGAKVGKVLIYDPARVKGNPFEMVDLGAAKTRPCPILDKLTPPQRRILERLERGNPL